MQAHPLGDDPDSLSLAHTSVAGLLAMACREALSMDSRASAVSITVSASPSGLEFDVVCSDGQRPTSGWGQ